MSIEALRKKLTEIAPRAKIDNRWGAERLEKEIRDAEEMQAKLAERKQAEAQEKLDKQAARDRIIAERGVAAEFVKRTSDDMNEDERTLRYAMRSLVQAVEREASIKEEFTANVMKHPGYALEWSDSFFDKIAKIEVAKNVISWFDGGASLAEIRQYATGELIRVSASRASSTSQCSNLMAQCRVVAWSTVVNHLT